MLDWLYRALGAMLSFFDSITASYAIALIFYALIFKIVFLPFSIKQQKNQIKMAKLTPKIELIRAKYRGRTDQVTMQKQQQEIMDLQQKEGYSPLSGCLPLLIQLPIIMLLYTVIQNPLSYIAKTSDAFDEYNSNYSNPEWAIENNDFLNPTYFPEIVELDENGDFVKYARAITQKDVVNALRIKYGVDSKAGEIGIINAIYNDDNSDVIREIGLDPDTIPNFMLFGVNLAHIVKEFMPKTRVDHMTCNVLHTAVIPVNGHPIFKLFGVCKALIVIRINIAQEVPRRTCPLGHCIGLALCVLTTYGTLAIYEFGYLCKR